MNPLVITLGFPVVSTAAAAGIGYGIYKIITHNKGEASSVSALKAEYAPGDDVPGPLLGDWATYSGARPELRGAPRNTILAVKGLDKRSPEFRARLLDMAQQSGFPVDTLAVVMSSESGLDPAALNPLPAAGLIQLTVGAHLEGFANADKIREVITWSAEKQLELIVRPYLERFGIKEPPTPGKFYMMNFLPKFAGSPDETVIGKKGDVDPNGNPTFASKVYDWNRGFDPNNTGVITVGAVKGLARRVASGAKRRRLTVDGRVLGSANAQPNNAAVTVALQGPSKRTTPPDGAHWLTDSAIGILARAVRRGFVPEPEWRTISWNGLDVEVFADALQMPIAFAYDESDFRPSAKYWGLLEKLSISPVTGSQFGAVTARVRMPVTYNEQIEIARKFGAVSCVQGLWDAAWNQADIRITPAPQQPDEFMASIGASVKWSADIDRQGAAPGKLVRDVGKTWLIHERLAEMGAVNYGWIDPSTKRPIQSVGGKHGPTHTDYSQTCVLARRTAKRNGVAVDLLDEYARLGLPKRFLDVYR